MNRIRYWWRRKQQKRKHKAVVKKFEGDMDKVALWMADLGTAKKLLDMRNILQTKAVTAQKLGNETRLKKYKAQLELIDALLNNKAVPDE